MNKYQRALDSIERGFRVSDSLSYDFEILNELVGLYTPETPIYEGDSYYEGELVYDTWICPNCEKHYEVGYDTHKHCEECGQRIDWTDVDE